MLRYLRENQMISLNTKLTKEGVGLTFDGGESAGVIVYSGKRGKFRCPGLGYTIPYWMGRHYEFLK